MIGTRDFRTWIAWRWYSKSIFDDLLECTSYTKQDLSKLRYGQKVSIVYGYDLKSQFDAMPGFSQVLVDWSKILSAHQAQEVVVKTFTEQLCLEYLKNRLAVGLTFVIPEALAKKKLHGDLSSSSVSLAALRDAFYDLPSRPSKLQCGDVVFSVIDARPEKKFLMNAAHVVRTTSTIIVRRHDVTTNNDTFIPAGWVIEEWNLRYLLTSGDSWRALMTSLFRIDDLRSCSHLQPLAIADHRRHMPTVEAHHHRPVRTPPAALADNVNVEELAIQPTVDPSVMLLNQIFRACEDKSGGTDLFDFDWDFNLNLLGDLVERGAIETVESDVGDLLYRVRPSGIDVSLSRVAGSLVQDIWQAPRDLGDYKRMGKLEMLYLLFMQGYRPMNALPSPKLCHSPQTSEPFVLLPMLKRSRLYLEALLMADDIFSAGFTKISHEGTDCYYACLLVRGNDDVVRKINEIEDITSLVDSEYKKILKDEDLPVALPVAQEDVGVAIVAVEPPPVPVVPMLAVAPPEWLGPMSFEFPCGHLVCTISLDGHSHQSGIRRAYGKCPWTDHEKCFKYCHTSNFPEVWQSIAFILSYMRAGGACCDKEEHQKCGVTNGDDLKSEMSPAILSIPQSG